MNSLTIMRLGVCTISSQCVVACTVWSQHAHRPVLLLPFRGSLTVLSHTTPTSASAAAIASGRARGVCPQRNRTHMLRKYRSARTALTALTSLYPSRATDSHLVRRKTTVIAKRLPRRLASKLVRQTVCASERGTTCCWRRAIAYPVILINM